MKQPRPDTKALFNRNRPATVINTPELKGIRVSLRVSWFTSFYLDTDIKFSF